MTTKHSGHQDWQEMQAEFLTACEVFTSTPRLITTARAVKERKEIVKALKLAGNLIHEEVYMELLPHLHRVFDRNDMIEHTGPTQTMSVEELHTIVDDIVDSIYVLCQLANTLGVKLAPFYAEVHSANMRKVSGNGHVIRREDGKILKPIGWIPPATEEVLAAQIEGSAGSDSRAWQVTVTEGLIQLQNICKMDTEMQMYMKNNDKATVAALILKAARILGNIAMNITEKPSMEKPSGTD